VLCGARGGAGLNLHHLTYARLGDEHLDDLLPACAPCHKIIHTYALQHPKLTLAEATWEAVREHRHSVRLRQLKKRARRDLKKAQNPKPKTDWAARLGLPEGQTTIRIKP
jgi:hypothetical protein